jgi:hypothetical protein
MPKLVYERWKPRDSSIAVVARVNGILDEYAAQGFQLTLRQVYYQCVARGWIPNRQEEYDKLGATVNKARLAGLIDWNHIEDRTRSLESLTHFRDPAHVIESSLRWFHTDRWAEQPCHVEVWIEKDALVGVIEPTCQRNDVSFFSCRGYTSQSEMWTAGQRLLKKIDEGKSVRILHLGDHDPSGIDMTRDIEERLRKFLVIDHWRYGMEGSGQGVRESIEWIEPRFEVNRLALNMDQIEQYGPPPNPAKVTDSRARGYIATHGRQSWELDALEPTVMADLIESAIDELRDDEAWEAATEKEERFRLLLSEASGRWGEVEELLAK